MLLILSLSVIRLEFESRNWQLILEFLLFQIRHFISDHVLKILFYILQIVFDNVFPLLFSKDVSIYFCSSIS